MSGSVPRDGSDAVRENLKELFEQAVDLDAAGRESLFERSGADSATREEILRLLGYREKAADYFSRLSDEIQALVRIEPLLECGEKLEGRFAIVRFLARGGMGEVYEAEDQELGGRLAVKVMRPGIVEHAGGLERFRNEIRLARGISSPHVCRVYDVGRHQESSRELIFFTMELLEGETLSDRLARDGPFAPAAARDLVRQMALGLDAAHRAGVLHRDFKSRNVMLCQSGSGARVVITDFGLSRQVGAGTAAGLLDGATPAYVAPEQVERHEETERTDLYSFGVVLFEMMTGELPFAGDSPLDTIRKRLTEAPPPLRRLRPDLPRAWEKAILRCLQRDPARRFPSVLESARELGVLGEKPAVPRRGLLVGAAAACVAAIVAWRRYFTAPPAAGPVLAVEALDAPEPLRFLADGVADRISDDLTDLPGVRVLARATTERLRSRQSRGASPAGLRPTHVLSGAVEANGGEYRITLRLSSAAGAEVWTRTRDVTRGELEGSSRAFVRELVHALKIDLLPAQMARVDRALTGDAVAYEQYLLGRYWLTRRDPAWLDESVRYLKEAVARDPGFAAAHAALGAALSHQAAVDGIYRPNLVQESNQEALRALGLNASEAEAHLVLARNAYAWDWDWKGAEEHFRRALELRPRLATGHQWYALLLELEGREQEALEQADAAVDLDPLDPAFAIVRADVLLAMGRTDEAIEQHRRLLSADPAYANGYVELSGAYAEKRLLPQAIEAAQRAVDLTGRASFALAQLGHVLALAGQADAARDILQELERRYRAGQASPSEVAQIYLGRGDLDKTFEWLSLGVPVRDFELLSLKVEPQYRVLRGDPRYRDLLARIQLQ